MPLNPFKKKERVITTLDKAQVQLNGSSGTDDLSFDEIEPGMVYSKVFQNRETGEINLALIEPFVDNQEKEIIEKLKNYLINLAAFNGHPTTDRKKDFEEYFPIALDDLDIRLGGNQGTVIKYYVERDVVGYGRIDGLMRDPNVEDISCDSSTVPVFVFHREHGYIMTNIKYNDDDELNRYVKSLIQEESGCYPSIAKHSGEDA